MLILWKLEGSVMPITAMKKKKKRDWKMSECSQRISIFCSRESEKAASLWCKKIK